MASGSVWRVRAWGTVTSTSSSTARNFLVALFWGGTKVNVVTTFVVKVSTNATLAWEAEFLVNGGGTTSATVLAVGKTLITNGPGVGSPGPTQQTLLTSGTSITSGSQTLDLQMAFSTIVAGDSALAQGITMERLQ